MFGFLKRRRNEAVLAVPFPEAWRAIVDAKVPLVRRLTDDERERLERLVRIFLADKTFEGCAGLTITDEMRVTIAAQACLLVVNQEREESLYEGFETVLVYPSAYVASRQRRDGMLVVDEADVRLGEAWSRGGPVVLAWDAVRGGAVNAHDGHNVVLHEFAHRIDDEDGAMDGAPVLENRSDYKTWARVLGAEFAELTSRVHAGRGARGDIDPYGATNPAEFFAVVTEEFFEQPIQLQENHPALYDELANFYRHDPARRVRERPKV